MKTISKILAFSVLSGLTMTGVAQAGTEFGLSRHELGKLRLSYHTDRNQDGRVSAEEILRTVPSAFDLNADGRIDARERGVALQRLRSRRFR